MPGWGAKKRHCAKAARQSNSAPIAKDSTDGPQVAFHLALIYAWTGDRDLAIEQLETVAKIPSGPTYGMLRLDPVWDSLRGNPRFEKLLASLAPN